MRIKLDTLSDFARRGYKARISCKCGRMIDHDPASLMVKCARNKWPVRISELEKRLTCGWCFQKGATITPATREAETPNVR